MYNIKNRKTLFICLFVGLLLILIGSILFGNKIVVANAYEEEEIRDGYSVENIRNLLQENSSLNLDFKYLTVYNEDGTMEDVKVPLSVSESHDQIQAFSNPSFNVKTIVESGRQDSQSIVITIMGDGFDNTEQADFIIAAKKAVDYMIGNPATGIIGVYPFNLFRDVFKVYAIEVISPESGVSRDSNGTGVINNNIVNNYFGSTFWHDGVTERLLYITETKRATELLPSNTSLAVILANSTTWGGGGDDFAVASLNRSAADMMIHELGHSFGALKDEYWWAAGAAEAPNMTKTSNASTVKWSQWIGYNSVGIYPHATSGSGAVWFKPHQSCIMETLGNPFCPVCSAALINKLESKAGNLFNTTNLLGNNIRIDKLNLINTDSFKVPERINGRVVTEIGNSAFANQTQLTQITIPASVTTIGNNAFYGCSSLDNVIYGLGSNLERIGDNAFAYCTTLKSVSIPNGVYDLGESAFLGCTSLENIKLPSFLTQIKSGTFASCINLESFTIPSSVSQIGISAFDGCEKLTSVTIPSNVWSIGNAAFQNCYKLEVVYAQKTTPPNLGINVFRNCLNLGSIYVNDVICVTSYSKATNWSLHQSIIREKSNFKYTNGLLFTLVSGYYRVSKGTANTNGTVYIPARYNGKQVEGIFADGFKNCTGLTHVVFEEGFSLEYMGASAFANCTALKDINLPSGTWDVLYDTAAFRGVQA